jgi:hypothetical protein
MTGPPCDATPIVWCARPELHRHLGGSNPPALAVKLRAHAGEILPYRLSRAQSGSHWVSRFTRDTHVEAKIDTNRQQRRAYLCGQDGGEGGMSPAWRQTDSAPISPCDMETTAGQRIPRADVRRRRPITSDSRYGAYPVGAAHRAGSRQNTIASAILSSGRNPLARAMNFSPAIRLTS